MQSAAINAPHISGSSDVARMMREVAYALVPGTIVAVLVFGIGVAINIFIATVFAYGAEAIMLKLRSRDPRSALKDGSALICAWLLALALPPLSPWWMTATGTVFAIVVAKQLFGGLGHNIFNPAMAGYCALIVSFPSYMTHWPVPGWGAMPNPAEHLQAIFGTAGSLHWDAITQATPLDTVRTQLGSDRTLAEIFASPQWQASGWYGWIAIAAAYLAGGLWLLYRKIIDWRIPASMLGSLTLITALSALHDPGMSPTPLFQLLAGGTMLGAFFIATDPVSASTTRRGRWIYGAGIGALTFFIRSAGTYPDGIAFAVLIMNSAVPLIDRYTVPRAFGHRRGPHA